MTAKIIDMGAYRAAKRRAERTVEELTAERGLPPLGPILAATAPSPWLAQDARQAAELVKFAAQGAPPLLDFTDDELVDLRKLFPNGTT